MKPFDLKAALAGEPVVTRNGRKVVDIIALKDPAGVDYPVYAVVSNTDTSGVESQETCTYTEKGRFRVGIAESSNSDYDLFMADKEETLVYDVYRNSTDTYIRSIDCEHEDAIIGQIELKIIDGEPKGVRIL